MTLGAAPTNKLGRIPSLDGIRAIAVVMVCVGHARHGIRPASVASVIKWIFRPDLGVAAFFVLSGYLITSLLLHEKARSNTVHLGGFYKRRALRILPAYYTFLLVIGLVHLTVGLPRFDKPYILLASALFATDYYGHLGWIGHTWSLSIEEQFYLVWPIVMRWLGLRGIERVAIGVVLAVPCVRWISIQWFDIPAILYPWNFMFHNRADSLMVGALAAIVSGRPAFAKMKQLAFRARLHLVALAWLACEPLLEPGHRVLWFTLGYTLENLAVCVVMLWLIDHPSTVVGRVFNSRIAVFMGTLSYSLYLWQQVFTRPVNTSFSGQFPQNLLFSFGAALISYYVVERPFLRYRSRAAEPVGRAAA